MARSWTIGDLDERVSLQRATLTADGAGGKTAAWAEYVEVWAHVRPLSGREREHAQRTEASSDYLVVIRNRDDVVEGDRIQWRGRELNVRFVKNLGPRSAWLELEAELGAAV